MQTKKQYLKLIVIILSVVTFFSALYIIKSLKEPVQVTNTQSNSKNNQFTQPESFKFNISNEVEIFPLGWSKTSNFAFIILNQSSFRGSFYSIVIQNTKSDKILEDIDFENVYNEYYESIEDLWDNRSVNIINLLKEYGITPQKEFYNYMGISPDVNTSYRIKYRKKVKDYYWENIDYSSKENMGFRISVSNNFGSKTISRIDLDSPFKNIYFLGSIKSPFEERIVIFSGYTPIDYQGDPYDNIYVSGCSLNKGFK